jgi:signal peptidase I
MKIKRIFIAIFIIAILAGGVAFWMMFGFYSVKYADGESSVFVRKTSSIKIGDVVAYRYPLEFDTKLSSRDVYVSRVVGVPGDIVLIDDGILYRNNKEVAEDYTTYSRYRASVDSVKVDFVAILSKYDVRIGDVLNDGKACEFVCSESEFEKINAAEKDFSACRKIIDRDDWKDVDVFPSSAFLAWNKDNFGPMYMPKSGDTLNLHPRIAPVYKNIITLFEGNDFQSDVYHVRVNQQEVSEYVTKKGYYFILNDDRTDKRDSRMYGPIPAEYIIGKVIR